MIELCGGAVDEKHVKRDKNRIYTYNWFNSKTKLKSKNKVNLHKIITATGVVISVGIFVEMKRFWNTSENIEILKKINKHTHKNYLRNQQSFSDKFSVAKRGKQKIYLRS